MRAFFRRTLGGLSPDDEASAKVLSGIAIGAVVAVEVTRPRNLYQLRLFWALCGAIADAIGAQRENVADVIKIKTGHVTIVQTKTETLKLPKSISFAKCTQDEFNSFMNDACRVVCEEFLPHMQPNEIRREIESMVGLPVEQAA